MVTPATPLLVLIVLGSVIMFYITLNAIGRSAVAVASEQVYTRREREEQLQAENAAAEAAGRAAALEPLALNPDGTIEEPIIGVVEKPFG